jgi:hypothetical protein
MLTKEAVKEFQEIYLKTFGTELSDSDATEQAHQLIRLYKLIYTIPASDDKNVIEEQRIECPELKGLSDK